MTKEQIEAEILQLRVELTTRYNDILKKNVLKKSVVLSKIRLLDTVLELFK